MHVARGSSTSISAATSSAQSTSENSSLWMPCPCQRRSSVTTRNRCDSGSMAGNQVSSPVQPSACSSTIVGDSGDGPGRVGHVRRPAARQLDHPARGDPRPRDVDPAADQVAEWDHASPSLVDVPASTVEHVTVSHGSATDRRRDDPETDTTVCRTPRSLSRRGRARRSSSRRSSAADETGRGWGPALGSRRRAARRSPCPRRTAARGSAWPRSRCCCARPPPAPSSSRSGRRSAAAR